MGHYNSQPLHQITSSYRTEYQATKDLHDDVIKWKHFPHYWPFVRGIWLHKGQRRGALTFSLICAWINGWLNNREAGDLRCHRAHYDVTVMWFVIEFKYVSGAHEYEFFKLTEVIPRNFAALKSSRSRGNMYSLQWVPMDALSHR